MASEIEKQALPSAIPTTGEEPKKVEFRDLDPDLRRQHDVGIDNPESSFSPQVLLALGSLGLNYMASAFGSTGPSALLSFINADIGPSPNYAWIAIGWTLANAVIQTIGGRLTDIFGRRYFMMSGAALSLVGAIVGGTAQNIDQLIGAGVILGVAAGSQQLAFPCVQEIVPMKWRSTVIGLFAFSYAPAQFAPVIGYALEANTSLKWRWMYWIVTILDFFALVGIFFFYHPPTFLTKHGSDVSIMDEIMMVDYVGLFLFTSGVVLFLLGLSWGGSSYPWKSAAVISTIIIGGLLMIALAFWEVYSNVKSPLLPLRLFRNKRGFVAPLSLLFVSGMLYYSLLVIWPLETNILFNITDLITEGWYANGIEIGTVIACLMIAILTKPLKHYNWQAVGAMVGQTAFIASLACLDSGKRAYGLAGVIIGGVFITYINLLLPVMLGFGVEEADIGIAIGLGGTIRCLGGAVATAIYTTILSNRLAIEAPRKFEALGEQYQLSPSTLAQLEMAVTAGNTTGLGTVPGLTSAIIAAGSKAYQQAYVNSFKVIYFVSIAFGVVAIVVACFTLDLEDKMTNRISVVLENVEKPATKVVEMEHTDPEVV